MSSKIVINILSHADEEAVMSEQIGMGDSVPAPPSSDEVDRTSASETHTQTTVSSDDAPAPPSNSESDSHLGFDESEAGPPDISENVSGSSGDMGMSGDAPPPPQNHPDVAGDDSIESVGSSGPPTPPDDEPGKGKKKKKGSDGKKK